MIGFIKYITFMLGRKNKKCYILHTNPCGNVMICKVLNQYDDMNGAIDDLAELLCHNIDEQRLLDKFNVRKEL